MEQENSINENRDTESTTSSNTEEAVTIHEPGAYPVIPVQESGQRPHRGHSCQLCPDKSSG